MTLITCPFDVDNALMECKEILQARQHLEQAEVIMRHIDYTVADYAVDAIETAIHMSVEVECDLNYNIDCYENGDG